jgi:hypothetical protein
MIDKNQIDDAIKCDGQCFSCKMSDIEEYDKDFGCTKILAAELKNQKLSSELNLDALSRTYILINEDAIKYKDALVGISDYLQSEDCDCRYKPSLCIKCAILEFVDAVI